MNHPKEKQTEKYWTIITFSFNPRGMLLGSGYIPRLNFSFMTKLMKRLLSPSLKSASSLPAGNDKSNFHWIGDLETNPSATGSFLKESASSEGMSSGLHACFLIRGKQLFQNHHRNREKCVNLLGYCYFFFFFFFLLIGELEAWLR